MSKPTTPNTPEKEIQWNVIEAHYRAGIKSIRAIAQDHVIAESTIRKRAQRDNWERDLTGQIKAKTESLVRTRAVRTPQVRTDGKTDEMRTAHRIPEKQIIEVNAMLQADVVMSHRSDIQRNRRLLTTLLNELELVTDNLALFETLGELLIDPAGDDGGDGSDKSSKAAQERQYKRMVAFQRALDLSSRVDSMKKLGDTLKTLVELERKVYGLDLDTPPPTPLRDLTDDQLNAQIEKLMTKSGYAKVGV